MQMIDSTHVKAHRSAAGGKGGRKSRLLAMARQSGWEARDNLDGESVSQRVDNRGDDCRAQEFC